MEERTPSPGRRILRHQARIARASGLSLARSVAARHGVRRPVVRRVPARPTPTGDVSPMIAREPAGGDAGMSDFATQWMFGDAGAALSMPETQPWAGGAGFEPPPPEQRRLNRLAREGAPAAARRAKIVEPGESLPDVPPPAAAPAAPAEPVVARAEVPPAPEALGAPGPAPAPESPARPEPVVARAEAEAAPESPRAPDSPPAPAEPTIARAEAPAEVTETRAYRDSEPSRPPAEPVIARAEAPPTPESLRAPGPQSAAAEVTQSTNDSSSPRPRLGRVARAAEPRPVPVPAAAAAAPEAPAPAAATEPAPSKPSLFRRVADRFRSDPAPAPAPDLPAAKPAAAQPRPLPPRQPARPARAAAPPAAPAGPAAPAPARPAEPTIAREPAATGDIGLSDFGMQWMFGDAPAALNRPDAQPWAGGAGYTPPPPEQRRLNRLAREGAPTAARRAKIVEPGESLPPVVARTEAPAPAPAPAEVIETYDDGKSASLRQDAPAPRRLARRPADPQPTPEPSPQKPLQTAPQQAPERQPEPEPEPEPQSQSQPDPQPQPQPQPPAADRPTLARVEQPQTTEPPQRPKLQRRSTPKAAQQHSRTTAEALAAATGATISRTEDGFAAVTFAAPGTPAPAQPTINRSITIDEVETRPAPAEGDTTARPEPSPSRPRQPSTEAVSEHAPSTDKDEIYEYVVDRLKRDLFAEQEQAGLGPTLL